MSNRTQHVTSGTLQERLTTVIGAYRGLLEADEQRLREAMADYERACWAQRVGRAA